MTPSRFLWILVALTVVYGLLANYGIGGGSDSYGYVSQADLWLDAHLHIQQPEARKVPWPFAQWTLSPLGYRPSVDLGSIVPICAPGLPMMMAAFKRVAGQCAVAWVVPLCGGLLVAATFGIGRRMFSDAIGAAGAFLLATSPAVIFMLAQPMSDLPVAAFWALAVFGCLSDSWQGDLLAALSASVAIVIRPNLAHLGLLMALWLFIRELSAGRLRTQPWRMAIFMLPVAAAAGFIAVLYRNLYGSATASGYGPVEAIYSLSSGLPNLMRYVSWINRTETPLVFFGALVVLVPISMFKPEVSVRGRALLAMLCLGVVGGYMFWGVFDVWWYLRFLLTAWPAICLTTAWMLAGGRRTFTRAGAIAIACIGVYCLWFSYQSDTFKVGAGERRYATVARLVRDATPPNSLIFSAQHSGSVRYYGGRMSLRYDWLSERWLDRSVAWLQEQGVHPYFLLDAAEIPEFRRRFEPQNALGHLNVARVWEYRGSPIVVLYDPLQPARPGEKITIFTPANLTTPSCPLPAPPPEFVLRDR